MQKEFVLVGIGLFFIDQQLATMIPSIVALYGLKVGILLGYLGFVFWREKSGMVIG